MGKYLGFIGAAALGFATFGAFTILGSSYAVLAGLTAFSIASSLFGGIGQEQPEGPGPQDLDVTASSQARIIPVIFGRRRLAGNIVRYDKETFSSRELRESSGGGGKGKGGKGGGGDGVTVGYEYYLTWEEGICMGPIDQFHAIYSMPGDDKTADGSSFSAARATTTLEGTKAEGAKTSEGGTVILYQGSASQTRDSTDNYTQQYQVSTGNAFWDNLINAMADETPTPPEELSAFEQFKYRYFGGITPPNDPPETFLDLNYRHVVWAFFKNFRMGPSPSPKSHLYELSRTPVCLDENGTPLTDFPTRAHPSSSDSRYYEANPAAIVWEILTNKIWGRGLSPAKLNVDDFRAAAKYYETNRIGMSLLLTQAQDIGAAIDNIKDHVGLTSWWDGDQVRCRIIHDTARNSTSAIRINSDMVDNVRMNRPTWAETINELRITFKNRQNNYQDEIVVVSNLAAQTMTGRIISKQVTMAGFGLRTIAEKEGRRMLNEISVPRATLEFEMNRLKSNIGPADLIEFIWSEWTEYTYATYWRVQNIEDDADAGTIKVTLMEDFWLSAREGTPESFEQPTPPINDWTPRENHILQLGEPDNTAIATAEMGKLRIYNLPSTFTAYSDYFLAAAERVTTAISAVSLLHRPGGSADSFSNLGDFSPFAHFGTLLSDNASTLKNDRESVFHIALDFPTTAETTLLSAVSTVSTASDDLEVLRQEGKPLMIINGEFILPGSMTKIGDNEYEITNCLRGFAGTARGQHATDDEVVIIPAFTPGLYMIPRGSTPTNSREFQAVPSILGAAYPDDAVSFTTQITTLPVHAPPPELYSWSRIGDDYTIALRPRFADRGAGFLTDLQTSLETLHSDLDGITYWIEPRDGAANNGDVEQFLGTFTPDHGNLANTGLVNGSWTAPAGTTSLRIYANKNGIRSSEYTTIEG
jgi:hypothetical protein